MKEKWVPVAGYVGRYEVGNFGHVRSWAAHRRELPHVMNIQRDQRGRPQVTLWDGEKRRTYRMAILVARHFLPPPEPGQEVCHNDGDQWNCRASNLRYDTHAANIMDSVRHGTHRSTRKQMCQKGLHPLDGRKVNWGTGRVTRYCKGCNREREAAKRAKR